MARRAKFGRGYKTAPSLTSTIVSIARQMQQTEDENIMSAWQNGGTFEGKKVTDSAVLKYWQSRKNDLAKDDPLSNQVGNQLEQLKYGIAQSKMQVLYDQKKISDAQFAQFYIGWEKKVPKDSEFYRTLQKNAAQLMQASGARGRQGVQAAKDAAFQKFFDGVNGSKIALGDSITGIMTQIARDNNLIGQDEDLAKFMLDGQGDPGHMEGFLAAINADMQANPGKYKNLVDSIHKLDPSWNGQLTVAYWAKTQRGQIAGYRIISDRATAEGRSSFVKWAQKGTDQSLKNIVQANAMPVGTAYATARAEFDRINENPHATDADKAQAREAFAKVVDSLSTTQGLDAASANRLRNDSLGLRGDPAYVPQASYHENYGGSQALTVGSDNASGKPSGEGAQWADAAAKYNYYSAFAKANPGSMVSGSVIPGTDPPQYDPSNKGAIGLVDAQSVANSTGGPTTIVPTTTITGQAIMLAVPVNDVFTTDASGKKVVVGQTTTYAVGGHNVTLYGTKAADGTTDWSAVSPWANGVTELRQPDGSMKLTYTANPVSQPTADALTAALRNSGYKDANVQLGASADGTSWSYTKTDVTGKETATVTVTLRNGQLVQDSSTTTHDEAGHVVSKIDTPPTQVQPVYAADGTVAVTFGNPDVARQVLDQSRASAPDSVITFKSPTMAALMANEMSPTEIAAVWQDPNFQTKLYNDEYAQAGGDPAKLAAIAGADAAFAKDLVSKGPAEITEARGRTYEPAFNRKDLIYPTTNTPDQQVKQGRIDISLAGGLHLPDISNAMEQLGPDRNATAFSVAPPTLLGPPAPAPYTGTGDKGAYVAAGVKVAPVAPVIAPAGPTVTPAGSGAPGGMAPPPPPPPPVVPPPPNTNPITGGGKKL